MYGPKYVWFFIGWYEDNWFKIHLKEENINCTLSQMEEAAEGHFTTEALMWNQDKSPTISGKVGALGTFFSRCLLPEEEGGSFEAELPVTIVRNGSWEGII